MNHSENYTYHAYLLRLWHEGGDASWRVMLEDTGNGRKQAFPTLQHLILFLEEVTNEQLIKQGDNDAP
jgi:hypothetical protein